MGQQGGDLPRNSIGGLFDRLIGGGKVIGLPLLVLCAGTSGCFSGFGETTTLNSLHSLGIRKSLACAAPSPKATPVPRSKTSFRNLWLVGIAVCRGSPHSGPRWRRRWGRAASRDRQENILPIVCPEWSSGQTKIHEVPNLYGANF